MFRPIADRLRNRAGRLEGWWLRHTDDILGWDLPEDRPLHDPSAVRACPHRLQLGIMRQRRPGSV